MLFVFWFSLILILVYESACQRDKHEWRPHHARQKNHGSDTIGHVHNIAHVNCLPHMHLFLPETDSICLVEKVPGKRMGKEIIAISSLKKTGFNRLTTNVPDHIETSQLICNANQLTGYYMIGNTVRQWVKKINPKTYPGPL